MTYAKIIVSHANAIFSHNQDAKTSYLRFQKLLTNMEILLGKRRQLK